jgi:hypothetical protein
MNNVSQTQLANIATVAGLLVILANQAGIILDKDQTAFIIAAVWSLAWTAYNYYQRYKKGDLTLGGKRK